MYTLIQRSFLEDLVHTKENPNYIKIVSNMGPSYYGGLYGRKLMPAKKDI
jgi:hypothetical protein